jgi:hypothetical protein
MAFLKKMKKNSAPIRTLKDKYLEMMQKCNKKEKNVPVIIFSAQKYLARPPAKDTRDPTPGGLYFKDLSGHAYTYKQCTS